MRLSLLSTVPTALAVVGVLAANDGSANRRVLVEQRLLRRLQRADPVNLVVTMRSSHALETFSIQETSYTSRGEKIEAVVERLQSHALLSQEPIRRLLAQEAASHTESYESHYSSWVMNAYYFQGATLALAEALASLPEVAWIREEELYELQTPTASEVQTAVNTTSTQWGVDRINAPSVWEQGMNGTGVVVGSIDSGVRATHHLLSQRFRRDYGWFSPGDRTASPRDQSGHGTHTMGTMVGSGGIGVAPGAQWIACQACSPSCTEAAIVQCTEWMLCPTDTNGNNKNCSKAPHVINNSWSTRSGSTVHEPIIAAWVAAGIVPVFSNGNGGPTCGTVRSPGDSELAISVGNVASDGSLAPLSSRGPTQSGIVKPDLSAPGQKIVSASHLNDDELRVVSGTSMAAPHVAGAVALLLSAQPGLSVAQIRGLLTSSADKTNVGAVDPSCDGGDGLVQWPNNQLGHGILDMHAAYRKMQPTPTPTPTPAPTSRAHACALERDVDLVGHDIGNAASESASRCCSLCLELASCRAFSWTNYGGGTCWFKDQSSSGSRTAANGVVSATVDRDSSAACQVTLDTDLMGNDLTSVASVSADTCCSLCGERRAQGCRAYTWSGYQGGTCWLKTERGGATRVDGVISGMYIGF